MEKVTIVRNETPFDYIPTLYKRGVKAEKGEMFLAPDPMVPLSVIVAHIGEDDVKKLVLARLNQFAQGWTESASTTVDADGNEIPKPFDVAEFTKYATEMSARGLSRAEIQEAFRLGTEELQQILFATDLTMEQKTQKAQAIAQRLNALQLELAARKRSKKDEEEEATV
jgi:DNA-binding protein